nr:hypothetical protein [Tanacetum cinerariifolium]
ALPVRRTAERYACSVLMNSWIKFPRCSADLDRGVDSFSLGEIV